jgi:Ca-activated chloride channel family protein
VLEVLLKRISYTKYNGELVDDVDLEDLMQQLSEFLLDSGFQDPMSRFQQFDGEHTLENLREALREALELGDFDPDLRDRLNEMAGEGEIDKLIDQLMQRMEQQGYIHMDEPHDPSRASSGPGEVGEGESQARFEVTDKSLDFLGYKTLQDLMGSLGRASAGRHDTMHQSTGVETNGSTRAYEFGDTLNLDANATLAAAMASQAEAMRDSDGGPITWPIEVDYKHLQVQQSDYQSSCATVVMLDCSHSMILYGEDRFTPAKRVAMALSHLIRTQYPGDTLNVVLFHDSAEEVPVSQIARVKVGPHYTNTREGLRLARSILNRQRKEMKQIVMITDGKPSALTLPDGRIYKNAFGLDPLVLSETLEEVARCRRAGILINTFMLASDPGLVQFVQRVSAMCRGKAYFTTPQTLGNYLMMDFMSRKMKTVH